MQTIDELSQKIKLTEEQKTAVAGYIQALIMELLESFKEDQVQNIEETIKTLNG